MWTSINKAYGCQYYGDTLHVWLPEKRTPLCGELHCSLIKQTDYVINYLQFNHITVNISDWWADKQRLSHQFICIISFCIDILSRLDSSINLSIMWHIIIRDRERASQWIARYRFDYVLFLFSKHNFFAMYIYEAWNALCALCFSYVILRICSGYLNVNRVLCWRIKIDVLTI